MKSSHLFQSLDPQTQSNMSDRLRSLKEDSSNSKEGKRKLNNEVLLDNYIKIGSRASNLGQLEHWV